MANFVKFISNRKEAQEKYDEIYSNSLDKVYQTEEYQQNKMQIDWIIYTLVKHADIPEILINWLVEAVSKNVALEYKYANRIMFKKT